MPPNDETSPVVLEDVRPDDIRRMVLDTNEEARAAFLADWAEDVDKAIDSIAAAQSKLGTFRATLKGDARVATVESFVHSAIYSLIAALHHLVSGYPITAGHMMRHFYESFAMAALCTDPESQVLEAFTKDRRGYRVDQAPAKLLRPKQATRLRDLVGLDPDVWTKHMAANDDFGGRSHATGLTLAFQLMLETDDLLVLGGQYDPAKSNAYDADLRRVHSCALSLAQFVGGATDALDVGNAR